jgi:hypothetical protein
MCLNLQSFKRIIYNFTTYLDRVLVIIIPKIGTNVCIYLLWWGEGARAASKSTSRGDEFQKKICRLGFTRMLYIYLCNILLLICIIIDNLMTLVRLVHKDETPLTWLIKFTQ